MTTAGRLYPLPGATSLPAHTPAIAEPLAGATIIVPPDAPGNADGSTGNYAELKALIRDAGLLKQQPVYYSVKIAYTLAMLGLGLVTLFLFDNFWVRVLNAAYLAFVLAQLGFLGHDTGHRQIFSSSRRHIGLGLLLGNVLLGMSLEWWNKKHNAHHANPNNADRDPDLDIPMIVFDKEGLVGKSKLQLAIVKYQAFFFFPMLMLAGIDFQLSSFRHVWEKLRAEGVKACLPEGGTLLAHIGLYYVGLILLLGVGPGLGFIALNQALFGFLLGSVFAPNHKGMETVDDDSKYDFLRRQVLTARNVRSTPFIDFMYGSLNHQIEHHLYPGMSRNLLPKARRITRDYCKQHGISYHETSVAGSLREILACLHSVGSELRARKPQRA